MVDASEETRGPTLYRLLIAMIILPTICLMLRFWSRTVTIGNKYSMKRRFWWDDWLALATLPLTITTCSLILYWTHIGLGRHTDVVPQEDVSRGLFMLYVGYFFYDVGISLPKLSALLFYARVFHVNGSRFHIMLWIIGGFVISWILFAIFSTIFQCTPIRKAWEPTVPGYCLNTYQWWLGSAISSVIIDAIILVLPMPKLWRLQLKPMRKVIITIIFISGYCVIGISIGRLVAVSVVNDKLTADIDFYTVPIMYWLIVEGPISIVSICLPSIFSLVRRGIVFGPYSLLTSEAMSRSGNSAWSKGQTVKGTAQAREMNARSRGPSFETFTEHLRGAQSFEYSTRVTQAQSTDEELGAIRVRKDVDVNTV